jgi:hypothetical protein
MSSTDSGEPETGARTANQTVVASTPHLPEHQHLDSSPLLFDALSEANFSLAEALVAENRGLSFISAVHTNNTVLHAAVIANAPTKLIKALVDKGLDPNARNDMGRTPTYLACRHNVRTSTLRLLTENGGDINVRDSYTYTPLMSAAYNGGSLTLLKTMLELGADLKAQDQTNRSIPDFAREGHHEDIAYFLDQVAAGKHVHPSLAVQSPTKPSLEQSTSKDTKRTKVNKAVEGSPSPRSSEPSANEESGESQQKISAEVLSARDADPSNHA